MRGVFPIGQTPFTPADKLDLDCLANEVKFCNRYKEDTKSRGMGGLSATGENPGRGGGGGRAGGRGPAAPLDEAGKQAVRDAWAEFIKPHLRG